jgi:hypothetical protein
MRTTLTKWELMCQMMAMWMAFTGIGLMVLAAVVITFARAKLKNKILRGAGSFIAFLLLIAGVFCGVLVLVGS